MYILKILRKLYGSVTNTPVEPTLHKFEFFDPQTTNSLIYDKLMNIEPCMIARFGSTELQCLTNYLGTMNNSRNWLGYIKGKALPWWWNPKKAYNLHYYSGFFPNELNKVVQFCELMQDCMPKTDILGSWLYEEQYHADLLKNAVRVDLELLNPYFSDKPWTKALENKKVLVIHPFSETIESQYKKRTLIFANNLLPEFELITIKAVQSIANGETEYIDWFQALDYMKTEINKIDFDICLIGAGAYGFPLAAYVKKIGKKGFHLGGSLQLLFGIKGKRWEDPNYNEKYKYNQLMNEYWVKPNEKDKPRDSQNIENACYW